MPRNFQFSAAVENAGYFREFNFGASSRSATPIPNLIGIRPAALDLKHGDRQTRRSLYTYLLCTSLKERIPQEKSSQWIKPYDDIIVRETRQKLNGFRIGLFLSVSVATRRREIDLPSCWKTRRTSQGFELGWGVTHTANIPHLCIHESNTEKSRDASIPFLVLR